MIGYGMIRIVLFASKKDRETSDRGNLLQSIHELILICLRSVR